MIKEKKIGDTELMLALRDNNIPMALSLLDKNFNFINQKNCSGETALFLALRMGNLPLIKKLVEMGADDDSIQILNSSPNLLELELINQNYIVLDKNRYLLSDTGKILRLITFPVLIKVRNLLSAIVRKNYFTPPIPLIENRNSRIAKDLSEKGVSLLGKLIGDKEVNEIITYLIDKPVYLGHTVRASNLIPQSFKEVAQNNKVKQCSYNESVVLNAPHLLDIATSPIIIDAVSSVFGCCPTIFDVNLMWSFPQEPDMSLGVAQSIHRDYDDYHTIVLFIYLTDVDSSSGNHRYYCGTHDMFKVENLLSSRFSKKLSKIIASDMFRSFADGYGRDDIVESLFGSDAINIYGSAGTAFISDPFGFHKGFVPTKKKRLLAWIRYGIKADVNVDSSLAEKNLQSYVMRMKPAMNARFINLQKYKITMIDNFYRESLFNIVHQNNIFFGVHSSEPAFLPNHFTFTQLDDIFYKRCELPKILSKSDCQLDYPLFISNTQEEVRNTLSKYLDNKNQRMINN